eukprot:2714956-Amphidinium_carterae.1
MTTAAALCACAAVLSATVTLQFTPVASGPTRAEDLAASYDMFPVVVEPLVSLCSTASDMLYWRCAKPSTFHC